MTKLTDDIEASKHELREAISDGELDRVREIIERHRELINAPLESWGITALMDAVSSMDRTPELVEYLLTQGANPNLTTQEGYNALHFAVDVDGPSCHGEMPCQIIRMLVDAGADLEAKQHWGWTPLMRAVVEGVEDEVQALCGVGARVDHVFPEHTLPECKRGHTMLMASVYDPETVRILMAAGADPYQRGLFGENAIEYAKQQLREPKCEDPAKGMEEMLRSVANTDPVIKNAVAALGEDFLERVVREFREVPVRNPNHALEESIRILTGAQT